MLPKVKTTERNLVSGIPMDPAEPLWKRLPKQDEHGHALMDFMMVLPSLRYKSQRFIQETIDKIEKVLEHYSDVVVFADLNLKLNVLCVMMKPTSGDCWKLAGAINEQVPEALLVAQPRF